MSIDALWDELRATVDERVWGQAVSMVREGAVLGRHRTDDEAAFLVRARGKTTSHEVYLWPEELDTGCDCGLPSPCVHAAAAVIALKQGITLAAPRAEATVTQVRLRYDFTSAGARLAVTRAQLGADGQATPFTGPLGAGRTAARWDLAADRRLTGVAPGPLEEGALRQLLVDLEGQPPATLDGAPIRLSREPVDFVVKVTDDGPGFQVGLYRPRGLDALFFGAARVGDALRPTGYGRLTATERAALDTRQPASRYRREQAPWIVTKYLPFLREKGLEVWVETTRLPGVEALAPRVVVALAESSEGLSVRPEIVYGDPPIARISQGAMVKLGPTVVVRDEGAERAVARTFEERTRLPVGVARLLQPADAVAFLRDVLPGLGVQTEGRVDAARFRVSAAPLVAHVSAEAVGAGGREGWSLGVRFAGPAGEADAATVLRAWQSGRSVVPLLDGGFAPLPVGWLRDHGAVLVELLEQRDGAGKVPRDATAALVELLEGTSASVPPDLARLQGFLDAGADLPTPPLAADLRATLRPYQEAGVAWMSFLRDMDLHGVLADDMGLGKTVQTLAVLASTPGPHLVVAPTSVLHNWAREAARFLPGRKVAVYHGPGRRLDPEAWLVLTSYTLLRMDLDALSAVPWGYAVLDEAQAIKNPSSQTAVAAFALPARHRLALTGTPVENRLEELWSLFRFLMPGLLGTASGFRERFVKPIEAGEAGLRLALRKRVRPYLLRRLKRQVATDLPPLTEIVERVAMSDAQRQVYDAVRQSVRRDVMDALGGDLGRPGATFQILEALLRMRQAACDPGLLPSRHAAQAPSAKLDRLEELLVELVPDGHKTLVFSQWTGMLDRVERRLDALGIPFARLDGATRDRRAVVDRFQSADGPPVFLVSLKAGGTGLNLTAADYVVHLDPWWNPAVEQQATDRAYRIGQDKPVVAIKIVAEDTVEERILELQEAKRELADVAVGEAELMKLLGVGELRRLFEA